MPRVKVMMGPPLDGHGGMSAVAAAYHEGGVLQRNDVLYISTVADGSRWRKSALALLAWIRLFKVLLWPRVSLVHIHVASGASFWRKLAYGWTARAFGVPVVWHVHGGNFRQWAQAQAPWAQRCIRASFTMAARTVVLSTSWIDRLGAWVPAQRAVALGNAVPPMQPRRAYDSAARRFLFLGRLEADKGVNELLQAFAQVHESHVDARLVLCGSGDSGHVQTTAAALGVADAIEMPGWIVGSQKLAALHAADAFVLPSYVEALPVSMLEAMQCGLAVIVTAVGSVPEVIESGRNGLLVPPRDAQALANAMLQLAASSELCTRLAREGQATFNAEYSIEAVTPRLERIWCEAMQRPAP